MSALRKFVSSAAMKRAAFLLFYPFLLAAFQPEANDVYPYIKNESFRRGEYLEYRMHYGIFNIGKGTVKIHDDYAEMNQRKCFKVDVFGRTTGVVDWVADVNDQWGAYIDTAALVPHMSYRKIREGRYKKDEVILFDHEKRKITAKVLDQKTRQYKEPVVYDAPPQVRDLIGGFMFMRTHDFSKRKINDTIVVSGFFEDEFYRLKVLYLGKETVKVKAGKFQAVVLKPIMPANKIFDGENSVTVWFSDDKNFIPLKVSANMFIGSAGVELTSFSGLRNPPRLLQ
ncbi:MAG: DUF3108 domain-containing protein [Cyclobacteriaceae bacterium]|nr:DUF3108 domain-containing protein [Cyclobacteriaceae bacterium]MDW8332081.1 DUF3108 domain-containing protein [Cyclobacteriaceae bacterium]